VAIIGVAEVAPPFSADASLLFRCGGASTSWRRSRTTGTRQSVRRSASDDPFRHDDADLGGYSFGDDSPFERGFAIGRLNKRFRDPRAP